MITTLFLIAKYIVIDKLNNNTKEKTRKQDRLNKYMRSETQTDGSHSYICICRYMLTE